MRPQRHPRERTYSAGSRAGTTDPRCRSRKYGSRLYAVLTIVRQPTPRGAWPRVGRRDTPATGPARHRDATRLLSRHVHELGRAAHRERLAVDDVRPEPPVADRGDQLPVVLAVP